MRQDIKKTLFFVLNPISGGIEKSLLKETIQEWTNENRYGFHLFETTGENDKDKLLDFLNGKELNQALIVAVGGDGTLKTTAEVSIELNLLISFIPAGSANGMARELEIKELNFSMDWLAKRQIKTLLTNIINGKDQRLDVIRINDQMMLHLADFGLNARLIKDFDEEEDRGFSAYAKNALRNLVQREAFTSYIETETERLEIETFMLAIANAKRYGTGAVINPKGSLTDNTFELVAVKNLDWSTVLTSLTSIITDAAEYDSDQIDFHIAKKASIQLSRKVPFQVDGEYQGEVEHIDVECLPGRLRFRVPRKE